VIIREIANGIAGANIGMTPVVDGNIIRLVLPMMTTEQRDDYIRLLGRKLEGARGMLRDARADFRKKMIDAKNAKTISEDEAKKDEVELQKITDLYMAKLEEMAKKKELEIRS
ncbi:ribosome-recycling factor, partial [Candidatus Shapirobacteria bacterium CG_4_8_14_3_um_filter_35_11]